MNESECKMSAADLDSDGQLASSPSTQGSLALNGAGEDSEDKELQNTNDLINYEQANNYWEDQPASLNGMLGGLGQVSHIDIKGSDDLLTSIWKWKRPPGRLRALDCGAGIGRITRQLLSRRFGTVDAVEQCAKFVAVARDKLKDNAHVGEIYNQGLQSFIPRPGTYDVIWCQWVLGHLPDDDLALFFRRCSEGLTPDGVIVVKENLTNCDSPEYDSQDSSVTRTRAAFERVFSQAELRVVATRRQYGMPGGLYPVMMFVLRPMKCGVEKNGEVCREAKPEKR